MPDFPGPLTFGTAEDDLSPEGTGRGRSGAFWFKLDPFATSLPFSTYFSGGDADDRTGLLTELRQRTRSAATKGTER